MGGIGDFCHYLYHNDSIVGVVLTILCVIFLLSPYEGRLGKARGIGKWFKEKSLCISKSMDFNEVPYEEIQEDLYTPSRYLSENVIGT